MLAGNMHQTKAASKPIIPWAYLSAISGTAGLILAFVPYFSMIGVLASLLAVISGITAFQRKQQRPWAWLGLLTGGLTLLAVCIIIGLVLFF